MFYINSNRIISYHGQENNHKIMRRKQNSANKITTLDDLFQVLLKTWEQATAYPSCQQDINFDIDNDPTYGQCTITAMLVYDMFGGTIHKVHVQGGGTHYFNQIGPYTIDLTRVQFDLYHLPLDYHPNQTIPRTYCGKNKNTAERYQRLITNITNYLNKKAENL